MATPNKITLSPSTKIGFFDSGIGGITILKKFLSSGIAECVYVADTAHMPYGNKTLSEIKHYSEHIVEFLCQQGATVIIISCHTATALALDHLRNMFNHIPIIGVVDLVTTEAVKQTKNNRIGIMATQATITNGAHKQSILTQNPHAFIFEQACPELASAIEFGISHYTSIDALLIQYLQPLLKAHIDTLILGSTHYDVVKNNFVTVIGNTVNLISAQELITKKFIGDTKEAKVHVKMFVTGAITPFFHASKNLLPLQQQDISTISLL